MWDMSVLQVVPGLRIAAPRDADQLRAQLREAVAVYDAPTLLRFPRSRPDPSYPPSTGSAA
ncbi:1-deoxy-D-xylulose-5-phosphate synthase OS=Streptomyces alboniger OX=132473 GN=dxs PE=3 SV=1 [Streptomyces alboniger]